MKMVADPLLLAVALGMLNPSVFQVDGDLAGEATPPPMLERVAEPVVDVAAPADDERD